MSKIESHYPSVENFCLVNDISKSILSHLLSGRQKSFSTPSLSMVPQGTPQRERRQLEPQIAPKGSSYKKTKKGLTNPTIDGMIFTDMSYLSSISKKQIMALSGLALCGFLVAHLAGNFLIFVGAEAFNTYAYFLTSNSFIYVAEAILGAIFITHIAMAVTLVWQNRTARGQRYYVKKPTGRGATLASATMPWTGLITLVFLVLHLWQFKFGPDYRIVHSGVEMRDLYRLLVEYFASKANVAWYIFAQAALGVHLSHGFSSAFQSLGFNHPHHTPQLKMVGKVFAIVIAVGFSSLPLWLHLKGGH